MSQITSFALNTNAKNPTVWSSLGKTYDHSLTAAEALTGAKADFTVETRDIFYMTPELQELINVGNDIPVAQLQKLLTNINERKVTVRTDNDDYLGVVSNNYGIVQNAHAFDFIDILTTGELGGSTPTIECAGVLGKGERIFITAKFPEQVTANNGKDLIDMYAVFTTSHDGSGAVSCMITPVRVVCNNALNLALSKSRGHISFRHTSHVMSRIDISQQDNAALAYRTLNMFDAYKSEFEEKIALMEHKTVTDKQLEKVLVKSLLSDDAIMAYEAAGNDLNIMDISTRSRNIVDNALESIHSGVGQAEAPAGTAWWAINGITTHYQNSVGWKDDTKKFDAIMDGSVQRKMQSAFDMLMEA